MCAATKREDKHDISYKRCSQPHLLSDGLLGRGNADACKGGVKYINTLAFCRFHERAISNIFLFLFTIGNGSAVGGVGEWGAREHSQGKRRKL